MKIYEYSLQYFVVGESRTMIGCHKLILSLHSNNQMLFDPSMDTIILPDFLPSTLESLVRYFYCGETFISDMTSLSEFLNLCEIFKLNVKGLEVEQLKGAEIEESLIEEDLTHHEPEQETEENLNTEGIEEIIDDVNALDEIVTEDYIEDVGNDEEIDVEERRKVRTENTLNIVPYSQDNSSSSLCSTNFKNLRLTKPQQSSTEPSAKRSKTR